MTCNQDLQKLKRFYLYFHFSPKRINEAAELPLFAKHYCNSKSNRWTYHELSTQKKKHTQLEYQALPLEKERTQKFEQIFIFNQKIVSLTTPTKLPILVMINWLSTKIEVLPTLDKMREKMLSAFIYTLKLHSVSSLIVCMQLFICF